MRVLIFSGSRELVHVMVPPIGEAYLASYLLSQGHEVMLRDLTLSNDSKKDISKAIDDFNPHLIGISIRNIDSTTYPANLFFYLPTKRIIQYIKEIAEPEIPIVLGGAGFSIFSEEILYDLNHDIGVIGDGEYVFAEILKYLKNDNDPRKIEKGICFIDGKGNYHQRTPWRVENLDDLPIPARQLMDNDEYIYCMNKTGAIWGNIQTKRGCPHKCIYCSYRYIEGSTVRYRSPEKIADELDFIVNNLGIKNIFFVDGVLNLNYKYLKEICQEIIKRKFELKWGANYDPNKQFVDLLPLMKESGATHLDTGFESLSEEMLKNIKENRTPDDAILTSMKCIELEIEQLIHVIIGGPGETLETVRASFNRLEAVENYRGEVWEGDNDVVIFIGMRIYPNTPLQLIAERDGIISNEEKLLKPKFYISPKIKEMDLFKIVREYCESNPRWFAPGIGLNNPEGFNEMGQIQFAKYQN
ncbi:MAG: B12-binding domain-containing radical SAM protein [Promethearchaeota archaeon]